VRFAASAGAPKGKDCLSPKPTHTTPIDSMTELATRLERAYSTGENRVVALNRPELDLAIR
jgi:hypothetical protein